MNHLTSTEAEGLKGMTYNTSLRLLKVSTEGVIVVAWGGGGLNTCFFCDKSFSNLPDVMARFIMAQKDTPLNLSKDIDNEKMLEFVGGNIRLLY